MAGKWAVSSILIIQNINLSILLFSLPRFQLICIHSNVDNIDETCDHHAQILSVLFGAIEEKNPIVRERVCYALSTKKVSVWE